MPDRDAWPTIRGYVYQVDQSILRWLDLQQDEILELERGEDIDLVLPGLAESDEELRRRLEQVKHRKGNLTLRSPEALAAIANYHAYRTTDSAARLYFCFTTNAQAGREKPSPMPGQRPALIVWNELRDGSVVAAQWSRMITGIRRIVASASAPDGIAPERWEATADFFASATDAQLLDFIGGFEWSMGAEEAPELGGRIRERLLTDGSVSDEAAAQAMRAEVMVRAEYGGELAAAVDVAEGALAQASSNARVQFFLRECAGRQYLYLYAGQICWADGRRR